MSEQWLSVPGYNNRYMVSNCGNVKLVNGGKCGRVTKILSAYMRSGYQYVKLYYDGKAHTKGIHQIVALAFIGPCPEGYEVNHIDGDKLNNAPENLEYMTRQENTQHAEDNGLRTHPIGTKHHCAKLNREQVLQIRELLKSDMYDKDIARMFNVSPPVIHRIKHGISYQDIF